MDEYELTSIVLDKLNREWDEIVRQKSIIVILGDLILSILQYENSNNKYISLGLSKYEYEGLVKRVFYNKPPNIWYYRYLLNLVSIKKCNICKEYKDISKFSILKSRKEGYNNLCILCDNIKSNTYRLNNRDKIKLYELNHIGEINAKQAKRRANKLNATPKWANLEKIKSIYKLRPDGYHVDHIIPLQGKYVCGLHVEYNLQYLLAKDTLSKGNKLLASYMNT